ncbi:MAG: PIG-L family deacetylase [Cryomorphaceae bacterium]|nr:MAG: PIG-L family deacetylase [Cryomorphaceae bacterium]
MPWAQLPESLYFRPSSKIVSMIRVLLLLILFLPALAHAQYGRQWSSGEILHEMHKLGKLGRVLYLAAHPDDENTRLIAHLANHERVDVAYLSLTRGDGGQNLIGPEIGLELGLIRSQELLAARRTDGGQQFFTRAYDFGYSKSADESFEKWGKEEVLSDVVWVIRRYRPDIIINRFSHDDPRGHGHHTASAMLSFEAFDLAGDSEAFPEQLQYVEPWQPKQLFHNVSTWWDKSLPERAAQDPTIISFEVGEYEPLLGRSMGEIASISRSQHSSQGFGSLLQRGSNTEYLQWLKGLPVKEQLFDDEDVAWSRVEGGAAIGAQIQGLIADFNAHNPAASVPALIEVARAIEVLPSSHFRDARLELVHELILQCTGLWCEATTGYYKVLAGDAIKVDVTALNRSDVDVKFMGVHLNGSDTALSYGLLRDRTHLVPMTLNIAADHPATEQYWLVEDKLPGMFVVDDPMLRGNAESDWPFSATLRFEMMGYRLEHRIPVIHKWADRAKGEQMRLLKVVPPLTVNPSEPVVVAPNRDVARIKVRLRAHADGQTGVLRPEVPAGWTCEPASANFELQRKNEETVLSFDLRPGTNAKTGTVKLVAETNEGSYSQSEKEINYDHIPVQTLLYPSEVLAVNFELETTGKRIGYIEGSGDDVPKALRAMGFEVNLIAPEDLGGTDLSVYDAIITGIRAYNVHNALEGVNHHLHEYVRQGGNLVVQYCVSFGLVTEDIGPYRFRISRDRVTDEEAQATILAKKHPLLNHPNKIVNEDFDNWVQERGLYFSDDWDEAFTPLIAWKDPGEKEPLKGGLIAARHGEGMFIYTGIAFFRQLPAGVPGAYRLLANLVAGGKSARNER